MESTRRLRWALWCALAGAALGVAGIVVDQSWHAAQDGTLAGWREVAEAHWLSLVAVVVTFASLLVAVWSVAQVRVAARAMVRVALAGATADLIGQVWDNTMHIGGAEADLAHLLSLLGAPVMVVGVLLALALTWRRGGPAALAPAQPQEAAVDRTPND